MSVGHGEDRETSDVGDSAPVQVIIGTIEANHGQSILSRRDVGGTISASRLGEVSVITTFVLPLGNRIRRNRNGSRVGCIHP